MSYHAHPSFGMTPTFREYDLWSQKTQILKSRCHTKRRTRGHPSFGMTTTKTSRSVFSWRTSGNNLYCAQIMLHLPLLFIFTRCLRVLRASWTCDLAMQPTGHGNMNKNCYNFLNNGPIVKIQKVPKSWKQALLNLAILCNHKHPDDHELTIFRL